MYLCIAILAVLVLAIPAMAAGNATVVYLKNDGAGDGSSAENAVGSLDAAYSALDLSKDCTIVVCGEFKVPFKNFDFGGSFNGSVTFTSVYGGKDYRGEGSKYMFAPYCFACVCETKFENINLESGNPDGNNGGVVFVAQHHPFTLGEGVSITGGKNLTGGKIATSFSIIGGYYKSVGAPVATEDKDVNIKVLSGSKIYIVAYNRNIVGTYSGKANIYIGGNAEVATLNASSTGVNDSFVGDVNITLTDNASLGNFYGSTQTMTVNSLEFNWLSGTIEKFFWDCPYMSPVGLVSFTKGTLLKASEKVQNRSNFADIASQFDGVETMSGSVTVEKGTVVFLKDGGVGNGKSAESAVGTFLDAFEALDLNKDCTVVICGTFTTPKANYAYEGSYEGSVTFTSVYDGKDYRKDGAKFVFMPYCYASACETKFENINCVSGGTGTNGGVVFVAQHHPFTLGEGVSITGGSNLAGGTIARSFTIVGGYYTKVGTPVLNDDRDTKITVLSGDKIYIVAVNRGIAGNYGGADIYIGGSATVSRVNATGSNIDGAYVGDIRITLADDATIGAFYGSTQTMTAESITLDWRSGKINGFYWDCPSMNPVGTLTVTNGTTLIASDKAKSEKNYADIAAKFTNIGESKPVKPDVKSDYGCAVGLYNLGLAQGYDTTGTNFGLPDNMTRIQTVVQVIRFLGKEAEVKAGTYTHPFTDVPAWANNYVGYAYANNITSGRSATKFDPDGVVDEMQFLTFMLRAIGYSDAQGDFVWNNPFALAKQIKMNDSDTASATFVRGDAFRISWNALYATAKSGSPVYDNLIKAGVFDLDKLDKAASAALSAKEASKLNATEVVKENGYYVLSKDSYRDKTTAAMLSQFAGVLTGYEHVYQNGAIRLGLPDDWFDFLNGPYAAENPNNKHEDKHHFNETLGLYEVWIDDDYSVDFFNLFMMDDMYEKYGRFATKTITDSWVDYCIYDMGGGHHTYGAYKLATRGYFAPYLGNKEYGNMYSVYGEPLIENETLGMVAAGMPDVAIDITETFASVTSDRDPILWAQFLATMHALAYVENDIPTIINMAKEMLPEGGWERSVIDGCFELYNKYPDDWRRAIIEADERFYRPQYDKDNGKLSETSIFTSFIVLGLLYGDGDYMETCKILSLAGHGGESSAPAGMAIVGLVQGWDNLNISAENKEKMNTLLWQDGKGVVYNRSSTELSSGYWMHAANLEEYFNMSDILDAYQRNFERMLLANGGKIENGNYYIPITEVPKQNVVLLEDFESAKLDAYKTSGTVEISDNFFTGKYGVKLSGGTSESRIVMPLSGLEVGKQYRVTSFIRTTAKTTAHMSVGDKFVTAYDESYFVKREMVFTATSTETELAFGIVGESNAFKYVVIDSITVERVDEKKANVSVNMPTSSDGKYTGKVEITVNGKAEKEVFLKVTFANPTGKLLDAYVTLNGDSEYGTVPFSKTDSTVANSANAAYVPLILSQDVNTVTLDTGDSGLYIYSVEVVEPIVNRY